MDTLCTFSSHQCFPFPGIILSLSAAGLLQFSMTAMEMKGLARTSCIPDQPPGLQGSCHIPLIDLLRFWMLHFISWSVVEGKTNMAVSQSMTYSTFDVSPSDSRYVFSRAEQLVYCWFNLVTYNESFSEIFRSYKHRIVAKNWLTEQLLPVPWIFIPGSINTNSV